MLKLKPQYFGHLMWRADSWEKVPDAGRNWGQEEKGLTEDEMVGWHHQLNGHEFEQTPGDREGEGSLMCCVHGVSKSQIRLSNWTTTELWFLKSHPKSGCATWLLFPIHCREEANSDSMLKLFPWLVFWCFCYYSHTECPTSENPATLPVKLKCLCSESWPLVDGRKEEINTSPAWVLPF